MKQSQILNRGTRSCHSMDSILSVQNRIFSGDGKKSLRKFVGPSEKPKVIYTDNHWNLANLVKTYHGIIELQHLIDPRQMASLKEPFDE